jgi:hypothetical protein
VRSESGRVARLRGPVLACLSAVLTLATLEAGTRLMGGFPRASYMELEGESIRLDCYPTNPRQYFPIDLRQPSALGEYEALLKAKLGQVATRAPFAVESRFNRRGFREREVGAPAPGRIRIAAVGDSFTEGQGVRVEHTYSRRLQGHLDAAWPGAYEVLNFGQSGEDFPQILRTFQRVLTYEPRIVVYGMVLNDCERSAEFEARQEYLNDWILDRTGARAPRWWGRSGLAAFVAARIENGRIARETTRWYLDMYGAVNAPGWRRTRAEIVAMSAEMKARGGALILMVWPLLVGLDDAYPFREPHREIGAFCRGAGIRHLDLLDVLERRAPESLWVHDLDMHPNEHAHAMAAEALARVLLEQSVVPRG